MRSLMHIMFMSMLMDYDLLCIYMLILLNDYDLMMLLCLLGRLLKIIMRIV